MNEEAKVYVAVTARFDSDGELMPLSITYNIDRVMDVRRAASLKAGGAGIRYTVRIGSSETFLFLEEGKWFVERAVRKT